MMARPSPGPGPETTAPPTPPQPLFGLRLAVGLFGILIVSMTAGLNGRVPALVLADIQGGLGLGRDDISWLTTVYSAGELAIMPFSAWFAITFSIRRFHLSMLALTLLLAALLPFVRDLHLLLALRAVQGMAAGALVPILMMCALRFLPPAIRLHGLALFAMTATFSPNIALWLAAICVDRVDDWRWAFWNIIPLGLLGAIPVAWGIPKMPPVLERLKGANWFGMMLGIPGLMLLVVGVDQGVRLDWFHSPLITASLLTGFALLALFLITEWYHPAAFTRLQLLGRHNVWLGFVTFTFLLLTMATAVTLPANILGSLQGFRMEQSASLGLIVGLPQLILGSAVAILLYQRQVDARYVFAAGLLCMSAACWFASGITSEWMVEQFYWAQILQAIGQPMAMVALLFLVTSVVQPMEGPFLAGLVNIIRVFGAVAGGALIGELLALRSRFHNEMLLEQAGRLMARLPASDMDAAPLGASVARQASVLAAADVYRIFAILALVTIPFVLRLQHIPAPDRPSSKTGHRDIPDAGAAKPAH